MSDVAWGRWRLVDGLVIVDHSSSLGLPVPLISISLSVCRKSGPSLCEVIWCFCVDHDQESRE